MSLFQPLMDFSLEAKQKSEIKKATILCIIWMAVQTRFCTCGKNVALDTMFCGPSLGRSGRKNWIDINI